MGVALVRSSSEPTGESPSASPLDQCANQIARAHAARCAAEHDALGHAIRAGELLLDVKQRLPHGEFLPWVQTACGLKPRRAQEYMCIARWARWVRANARDTALLTITEALNCIRAQRVPDRPVCFSFAWAAQAQRFWYLLGQCHARGDPGPLLLDLLEAHVGRPAGP